MSAATLHQILYSIDPYDEEECAKNDVLAADAITSFKDLYYSRYYYNYGKYMPLTKDKINNVLCENIDSGSINYGIHYSHNLWSTAETKKKLIKYWLNDNGTVIRRDTITLWMVDIAKSLDKDVNILDILEKITNIYKYKKSQKISRLVGQLFADLDISKVDKGCEILSKSTPAISANLLKRNDISDKYVINGLKSLSKLSKQRNIDIKVDFKALEKLGPKGRLDAMKQLLGMFNVYYQKKNQYGSNFYYYGYTMSRAKYQYIDMQNRSPFVTMPTKEEIERLLFPCSLKYNKEVANLVERFEEIYNNQPKEVK
jgi:predicted peroxiredoxin